MGDEEVAVGERLVPSEPELAAVDLALNLKADAIIAPRILAVLADLADQLDRLGDTLDGDIAGQLDLAVAGSALRRSR